MALNWRVGFPTVCLLCLASLAVADEISPETWNLQQFTAQEHKHFQAGKVVSRTLSAAGNVKDVHAIARVQAPAQLIFSIITDYASLPEFMPNLARTDVLESSKDGALVNYYLGLPFGHKKQYRLKLNYESTPHDYRMTWVSVPWPEVADEDAIVSSVGFWHLSYGQEDGVTTVHYSTKTDPGDVPFGLGWLVDYLTKQTVVEMLENTKKRAEQQWKLNQSSQ